MAVNTPARHFIKAFTIVSGNEFSPQVGPGWYTHFQPLENYFPENAVRKITLTKIKAFTIVEHFIGKVGQTENSPVRRKAFT